MTPDNKADTKKTRDNIDTELSRTYFSGVSSRPAQQARIEEPKKNNTKVIVLSVLVLLIAIATSMFFIMRNNVSFTVNVNVGDTPQEVPLSDNASEISDTASTSPERNSAVLYGFEAYDDNWEIPSWTIEKRDHTASELTQSTEISSEGIGSLEILADFQAKRWSGALVEIQQYLDLVGYDILAADIYIPSDAPSGLKGKIILTVGDEWRFVEMSWGKKLTPGEWTVVTADISDNSRDWKRTVVDSTFRTDIRKISIRVESDKNPAWSGKINIDNVRALVKSDL